MRQQDIDRLLESEEAPRDHSLQGHSLHRAKSGQIPRTLTAHEWEQWYAERGIPAEHNGTTAAQKPVPRWRKLINYLRSRQAP